MYIIFVFAISIYYFILAIVFLNKRHSFDTFPSEGFLLFTDYLFKSCLLGCLGLVAWALLHIWNFSEHRRFKDTQYRGWPKLVNWCAIIKWSISVVLMLILFFTIAIISLVFFDDHGPYGNRFIPPDHCQWTFLSKNVRAGYIATEAFEFLTPYP